MSHYLVTHVRLSDAGEVEEVTAHLLAHPPESRSIEGIGPGVAQSAAQIRQLLAEGAQAFVSLPQQAEAHFEFGDEIRADPATGRLESFDTAGRRTDALQSLPVMASAG